MAESSLVDVYTRFQMVYNCLQCARIVDTEVNHTPNGIFWSPASRYWRSPGNPSKMVGAFCSAQCASDYKV